MAAPKTPFYKTDKFRRKLAEIIIITADTDELPANDLTQMWRQAEEAADRFIASLEKCG